MSGRAQYVSGRIDIEEFEQLEERRLLAIEGRRHPVPRGWEPLPPCEHEWIDVTHFGSQGQELICARCGDESW